MDFFIIACIHAGFRTCLGLDTPCNGMPRFFAIEYKQEVRPGDLVYMKKCKPDNEGTYLVEGTIARSGQVGLRARIIF